MVKYLAIIQKYTSQKLKANFIDDDIEVEDEVLEIDSCETLYCNIDYENGQEVECIV